MTSLLFRLFSCLFIFVEINAFSEEISRVEETTDTGIHGLYWKAGPLSIVRDLRIGTYQIQVSGFYQREVFEKDAKEVERKWKLYLSNYEIPLHRETGEFTLQIPVDTNHFKAEFTAVGPNRGLETEDIFISLNNFFPPKPKNRKPASWTERQLKDVSMSLGLGTAFLNYEQTGLESVTGTNVTPKLDFAYVFPRNEWSLEYSAQVSALSFSGSPLASSGLGVFTNDLRVGYEVPLIGRSTALYLFGGFYYSTTFGSENVGYKNVAGPEIYPALRKAFENGSQSMLYVRYAPILNGFSLLTLDNAVLTGGISYYFAPAARGTLRGIPLGMSFDATRVKLNLAGGNSITTVYFAALNILL